MQKPCNLNKIQETQQRTNQTPQNNQKGVVINVKLKGCVTLQVRHSEKRICELEDGPLEIIWNEAQENREKNV